MKRYGMSGSQRSSVSEDEVSVSSSGTVASSPTHLFSYSHTPWEYGTNRCASQKGMSAFGSPRNVVTKVTSTRLTPSSCDGVLPRLTGGGNPTAKFQPFGDTRDVVRKTEENNEKKPVGQAGISRRTETFLSRWATSNPNANNGGIGRPRNATLDIRGSLRLRDRRGEGVLPRLQNFVTLPGTGAAFHGRRQATMKVEGLDLSFEDEAKSKTTMPWATGPSGMQTQSGTGGFLKPRDVCNMTYYDEKKPKSSYRWL